jgi:hypothetical protein
MKEVKDEIMKEKDEIIKDHMKGYELEIETQEINDTIEYELGKISAENKFNKRSERRQELEDEEDKDKLENFL